MQKIVIVCIFIIFLFAENNHAIAGELSERLANFPQWEKITSVQPAKGDLIYPQWMAGTWEVKSTLVDLAAPLAPDIVTPGFEGNRQQLNKSVSFLVRFIPEKIADVGLKFIPKITHNAPNIVADRAFNSLNLAKTYLGDETVLAVKVDPDSPNRQITFLRSERQLVSIVTARATETTADGKFITTEVFQQIFKGSSRPYLNSVESTTAYHQLSTNYPAITADQVTAVYSHPKTQIILKQVLTLWLFIAIVWNFFPRNNVVNSGNNCGDRLSITNLR